jgi:hypothetical protein
MDDLRKLVLSLIYADTEMYRPVKFPGVIVSKLFADP